LKTLFISDAKPKEPLRELAKNCEIIILLGDLFYEWIEELRGIDIPIIGVTGNHDFDLNMNPDKSDPIERIGGVRLHLNTFTHKGIKFAGFNGDMAYVYAENNSPYWKGGDMDGMRKELEQMKDLESVDVLLTHFPSEGTLDTPHILGHKGIRAFRDYIDRVKPKYHFHGHMHKPMEAKIDGTEVACVYPYLIVDI
jgi:Icc-related predicted phosphoesterase